MKSLAWAAVYVEKFGLSVIPIGQDKKPCIKWGEYQCRRATIEEIISWPSKANIAVVTGAISNLVIVDCESPEDAKWFWNTKGKTETSVKTKRGYHLYFRHPGGHVPNAQKVDGKYDVRGDGGYALLPPSEHSEGEYSWHKPFCGTANLPVFDMAWRPIVSRSFDDKKFTDGIKYISHIRAISGSGGHADTYRAACVLKESGLSEAEALLALQEWNETNADPKWTSRELLHKISGAYCQD